jgi:hypothetical protein
MGRKRTQNVPKKHGCHFCYFIWTLWDYALFPWVHKGLYLEVVLVRGGVPADVSKRGVDDGNQKGGSSTQPAKQNHFYSSLSAEYVKSIIYFIFKYFFLASQHADPGHAWIPGLTHGDI